MHFTGNGMPIALALALTLALAVALALDFAIALALAYALALLLGLPATPGATFNLGMYIERYNSWSTHLKKLPLTPPTSTLSVCLQLRHP